MSSTEIGEILNAIGQHTANILGGTPRDVFVYIRADDQWMTGAVFDNLENEVIYHDPNEEMVHEVLRLWEAADPDKKWDTLHYDIKDGKFTSEFFYPEQLNPDDNDEDLRARALTERFGDKPVIYPEPDDGDWHELTEEELAVVEATEYDWDTGAPIAKG